MTSDLINKDGSIAVDPQKHPELHRALGAGLAWREQWARIVELHRAGQHDAADRLRRKILGLVEPMSDEAKAKLRAYNEDHKDEIRARAKIKRIERRRLRAVMKAGKGRK
jgi:hypothetical protein